jgi:hypothetical protein
MEQKPTYEHAFSSRDSADLLIGSCSAALGLIAVGIALGGLRRGNALTTTLGFVIGGLLIFSALSDLYYYLFPQRWEFYMDDQELRWTTPVGSGAVELQRIEEATIDNTGGSEHAPPLQVRTVDGSEMSISGEHLGSPKEVTEFLRERLGPDKVHYHG